MFVVDRFYRNKLRNYFEFDFENDVVNAYFYGSNGVAWVNSLDNPTACQIIVGDYSFFSGEADSIGAQELAHNNLSFSFGWIIETLQAYIDNL